MHATSHDGGTIRAASLVRVSTEGQADKGLSLDEQDRRVAKYISDQEWTPALHFFRRLRLRWERRADIHQAFMALGCAIVCQRYLRTF